MTVQIRELLNDRSVDTHNGTGTRRWIAFDDESGAGVILPTAMALAQAEGIVRGAPHPDEPGIVSNAPTFDQQGQVVYIDTAFVVPEVNYPQRPIDPLNPEFESLSTTYRVEQVEIEAFVLKTGQMKDGAGGVVEIPYWQAAERKPLPDKQLVVHTFRLSGTFEGAVGPAQWIAARSAIEAQSRRLHKFGANYYLFEPRQINQERARNGDDPARFRIEYTWTFDPGIEHDNTWTASAGDQPLLRGDGGIFYPVFDDTFVIPPWTNVWTAPAGGSPENAPVVLFRDAFPKDDNGWQTLPGMSG